MVHPVETDLDLGAFRWAYRRLARAHKSRNVAALVAAPVVGALIALGVRGSLAPGVAILLGALGAYVLVFATFGLFATVVAPYEQRALLRRELSALATRLHALEHEAPSELVEDAHAHVLRAALHDMMVEADALKTVAITGRFPRTWVVAHFGELRPEIESWNERAATASEREMSIEAKYRLRIQSLKFVQDGFARDALDQLLNWVKSEALSGRLDEERDIEWAPLDPDRPKVLTLWTGRSVVQTSDSKPNMSRSRCQDRLNAFVREMRMWKELGRYAENKDLFPSSEKLLIHLKARYDQHAYFKSAECPRCDS